MNWKVILYGCLGVILPVLYSILKSKYPDMPLSEEGFIELALYFIGGLIGGWQALKLVTQWQFSRNKKLSVLKYFGRRIDYKKIF